MEPTVVLSVAVAQTVDMLAAVALMVGSLAAAVAAVMDVVVDWAESFVASEATTAVVVSKDALGTQPVVADAARVILAAVAAVLVVATEADIFAGFSGAHWVLQNQKHVVL